MKKINKDNSIFLSKEFQQEKYMFYGLFFDEKDENIELYSDEENYIICINNDNNRIWIWTKNKLDKKIILEIITNQQTILKPNIQYKIICKKELYKILKEQYQGKFENYFEQNFFMCNNLKRPKNCLGYFDTATINDKDIIAKYWYNAHLEMNGVTPISLQISKNKTEELIKNNSVYVWKDNNKIVSIGYYAIKDNQAKIMGIYTHPEYRKNNYAKNLVYNMTNLILEKGYIPTLYTDSNYIPSNKTYTSIGYEVLDNLISFTYLFK